MIRALVILGLAACGNRDWLVDAHIIVDGYDETNMSCRSGPCVHDENTDLIELDNAIFLVHRTAQSQVLSPNSSLRVSRTDDHGKTWQLLSVLPAPIDRDIRDPSFYIVNGQLVMKAITRIAFNSTRDTDVLSVSVDTISSDGVSWSPYTALAPTAWSFWRVREDAGIYYSAAYQDGDLSVKLFSSQDGRTWSPGAIMYDVAADTPLETELVFDGNGGLRALVRMDGTDAELLGNEGRLRTKLCTSQRPYTSFECSRELTGVRLDGPVAFGHNGHTYVVARKHLAGVSNKKRTALYELVGDGIVEHGEFPSAGDTSYAGVAAIGGDRYLITYYSSNVLEDGPWARAIFGPTDIWQATIDVGALER
jgi:hypothetical protein